MAGIRREYKKKYDAELADDVKHKCKGHPTEKIMVELAGKSKGKVRIQTQCKGHPKIKVVVELAGKSKGRVRIQM
jgi:hypothetical protein